MKQESIFAGNETKESPETLKCLADNIQMLRKINLFFRWLPRPIKTCTHCHAYKFIQIYSIFLLAQECNLAFRTKTLKLDQ